MDRMLWERARLARDPRFDGRFYIGVKTTGIYCRPVCPVKLPKPTNVTFFPSAAAAAEAGFRPCLRCRPEASPGTPAWLGTSAAINRALRLIAEGALNDGTVTDLSVRLGVTVRHLNRLFTQHIGASPTAVAQTQRLHFAKKLLDETELSILDIALSSGYKSLRRFNDHFKQIYQCPPSTLRARCTANSSGLHCKLNYRPPYDYTGIFKFLKMRAIPAVEQVTQEVYTRSIRVGKELGQVRVTHDKQQYCLNVCLDLGKPAYLLTLVERLKRMFDLAADPLAIGQYLARDADLSPLVQRNPGQRLVGSWDPFEIAVRAIVGQQVSVKGATTIMGRIAARYGLTIDTRCWFPTAEELKNVNVDDLPMPKRRAEAIKQLSIAVAHGEIDLSSNNTSGCLKQQLMAIKGIGEWTAQYVVMRALNDPDAFLHNDLVLLKVAKQHLQINSAKELLHRAERWRPWRAYASMYLWRLATNLS